MEDNSNIASRLTQVPYAVHAEPHHIDSPPSRDTDGQNHDRIDIEMDDSGNASTQALPENTDTATNNDGVDTNESDSDDSDMNMDNNRSTLGESTPNLPQSAAGTAIVENTTPVTVPPPQHTDPLAEAERSTTNTSEHPPEHDDTDDSNEDEQGFWAHFQEDDSSPSSEELHEIERVGSEISALDHSHWEKITYEDIVNDPEITVADVGRITWTVKGFHGTKEAPSKERVIESPAVSIGGFEWKLKLYPRGSEPTDHLSVHVECLGPVEDNEDHGSDAIKTEDLGNGHDKTTEKPEQDANTAVVADNALSSKRKRDWCVAAQVGCVMYNPEEPRVRVHDNGKHHFEKGSQHFGWVRFHGPWDLIHKRQHLQRKAILCNDTLAFTVYIRTFNDPTGALWWDHLDNSTSWDSLAKTGNLGMRTYDSTALVAALSSWIHLKLFEERIRSESLPDPSKDLDTFPKPLIAELQKLYSQISEAKSGVLSLAPLTRVLGWYDRRAEPDSDVIEIWDTLLRILSKESDHWDGPNSIEDASTAISTLRQTLEPDILARGDAMDVDKREPQSVQETLDEAWKKTESPPALLQLELHRQDYDMKARKWKKLTHRIEIDETIVLPTSDSQEYTLYGMVVHNGALGSGDFSSIVRPGGPESKWIKYDSPIDSATVLLTKKQAIDAHQGDSSDATASIVYIVSYIRSDLVQDMLPILKQSALSPNGSITKSNGIAKGELLHVENTSNGVPGAPNKLKLSEITDGEPISIHLFESSIFAGWPDRGFVDMWGEGNKTHLDTNHMFKFVLPSSATISEVREYIVSNLNIAGMPEQCKLWALDSTVRAMNNGANCRTWPRLRDLTLETSLKTIAEEYGGCRLWLHTVSIESIPIPPSPPSILVEAPVSDPSVVLSAEPSPPTIDSEVLADITGDVIMGGTQDENPEQQAATQQSEEAQVVDRQNLDQQSSDRQRLESQSQEQQNQDQPPPEPSVPPPPAPPVHLISPQETYFFLKSFDPKAQKLAGIGSYVVSEGDVIRETLERLQVIMPNKKYIVHKEYQGGDMRKWDSCLNGRSFSSLSSGTALIVQEELPADEIDAIVARGDCKDVEDYFDYLHSKSNPAYELDPLVVYYFGGQYLKTSIKNGRPHGHCIRINTAGDAYAGNCVSGLYSGHGTMNFANGDTYTGNWAEGDPHGQGTMVYGTTGNTYTGGWKNGRRHGKGTMQFEVADEDLAICRICYETEMDALFYRCGHVVACEECARQVSDCPVCRRPVDAVVKIWKT